MDSNIQDIIGKIMEEAMLPTKVVVVSTGKGVGPENFGGSITFRIEKIYPNKPNGQ